MNLVAELVPFLLSRGYAPNERAPSERELAEIGVPLPGDEGGQAAEVRRIQELEAIRLACRRHREEDIEALRRCLADWENALDDATRIAELDRVFHCGIVRATQNAVLLRLVNVFYLMTEGTRAVYFGNLSRREQSLREHREILDALVHRDEERGVRLLDAHMSGADSYWQDLVAGSAASAETVGSRV